MTTDSQRDAANKAAAKIADKYIPRDGLASAGKAPQRAKSRSKAPETPEPKEHVSKPLYSSGEGTTAKVLLPPKVKLPRTFRPHTKYSDELFHEILRRISCGETLTDICDDEDMPAEGTFYSWIQGDMAKNELYARAQYERTFVHAEQLIAIADNCSIEEVNKARLRIDTRKWSMAKANPKRFAERTINELEVKDSRENIKVRELPVEIREMMRAACQAVLEERDDQIIDVTPEDDQPDV